ncbi:tRNA (adenosine(37)-N6)-threonylcarbamoyltransferase complex dimerization subunit type 1 TsaB [Desulfothermobacter acidiphilus]|uniref:tRNA (adenosine(37)-N6)-threonylcarbamoyltransferase complex dimerization subunit type 1 TsaB n=1 Tax=Desulfothermobacter acidiphilus TaxID=1938353 RepID=UPI003F8CB4A7
MHLVLGLETSTSQILGVAVVSGEGIMAETTLRGEKWQAESLLPQVQNTLAAAGVTPGELAAVAVAVGPGSFTGVRLGVVAARTLAQALSLRAYGVPTLKVLAWPWRLCKLVVCPLIPSRRRELFAALYHGGDLLKGPWAASPEAIAKELRSFCPVLLTGAGARAHAEFWQRELGEGALLPAPVPEAPAASLVAWLGLEALRRGERGDFRDLVPIYLRPAATYQGERSE